MPSEARVRINLTNGELEVEGTPDFVAQYDSDIKQMLERLKKQPVVSGTGSGGGSGAGGQGSGGAAGGASGGSSSEGKPVREFGEIMHALPSKATGTDQMLVAGWYVQQSNNSNTFTTGDANKLLIGQGVKVSNASQSLKNNLKAKRVFKVGNAFRVSKDGEDHLRSLLGSL